MVTQIAPDIQVLILTLLSFAAFIHLPEEGFNTYALAQCRPRGYQALFASLACIVCALRSKNASTNSPTGIFRSIANRSNVSSEGICLQLNQTDQVDDSTVVRRFNSLYESSKNSCLVNVLLLLTYIKFTSLDKSVIVSVNAGSNRLGLATSITQTYSWLVSLTTVQTTKHPPQVLCLDQYSAKDGTKTKKLRFSRKLKTYEHLNRPKGRSPSPNFFVRSSYADMGGRVMKDYPNGYINFLKHGFHPDRFWHRLVAPSVSLHYQEDDDVLIPTDSEGDILSRQNVLELICELEKFCLDVTDEEIQEFNNRGKVQKQPTFVAPPKVHEALSGWVYLIRAEDTNKYKIGWSANPENRLKQLQKENIFNLHFIHLIKCADSKRVEKELHERFKANRIKGEWFAFDADAVDYICSLGDRL